jgi:hypothetical protein
MAYWWHGWDGKASNCYKLKEMLLISDLDKTG